MSKREWATTESGTFGQNELAPTPEPPDDDGGWELRGAVLRPEPHGHCAVWFWQRDREAP